MTATIQYRVEIFSKVNDASLGYEEQSVSVTLDNGGQELGDVIIGLLMMGVKDFRIVTS